jgi:hypothetical protein
MHVRSEKHRAFTIFRRVLASGRVSADGAARLQPYQSSRIDPPLRSSRPAPRPPGFVRCLYNVCDTRVADSGGIAFDSMRERTAEGAETACCAARNHNRGVNWKYSKIPNTNNILQKNFNHKRVLFVQHPSEKGRSRAIPRGSFVACAEVLGNCDRATEGGIPRSSRFRWFA